jgi:hypothetical protein
MRRRAGLICAVVMLSGSAVLGSADPAAAQLFFSKRPTVCTQQYAPVCGVRNGMTRTYSNACTAEAAGARVIANGPCRRARPRR